MQCCNLIFSPPSLLNEIIEGIRWDSLVQGNGRGGGEKFEVPFILHNSYYQYHGLSVIGSSI
jgi:hypothetical protein